LAGLHLGDLILETRGLTKEFRGFTAVRGVDLKIRRGTIHALIGPNGAGKTTVFNLLTKFLEPTAGRIIYDGDDVTSERPAEIARRGIDARSEHVERAVHAEAGAAEEREVAGLDVLLQLLTLGFCEPTRGDGGVDPVLERLLERRAERAGRDAELLRRVVHHRLALLLR